MKFKRSVKFEMFAYYDEKGTYWGINNVKNGNLECIKHTDKVDPVCKAHLLYNLEMKISRILKRST
ncbi:MAG: hypothetical protein K8823_1529 [Cenarchaeum symbiont of Oopsacas minuta]|nr:hypothetical protein [Cenarchaeum symbiont of Oopsacas minuta]